LLFAILLPLRTRAFRGLASARGVLIQWRFLQQTLFDAEIIISLLGDASP